MFAVSEEKREKSRVLLVSKEATFSTLLESLIAESPFALVGNVGPAIALDSVRNQVPSMVLIDIDSIELQEVQRLILKIRLLSRALVVLTGVEACYGANGLDPLFVAGANAALMKPDGKLSLGLSRENGLLYLKRLEQVIAKSSKEICP
jgi:AmiR/NasT family two-component response regulator